MILRDYKKYSNLIPDMIFGWDNDETKRKPSAFPVNKMLQSFNLKESEALIIDDLKPGLEMARSSKVKIAGAGWGHKIPLISNYMKSICDYFFESVNELERFLFLYFTK